MRIIEISGERGPCELLVESGSLERLGELLELHGIPKPRSLVSNVTVGPLHGARVAEALGVRPPVELPDGERFKRWEQVEEIIVRWLSAGVHRGHCVMAVGGGVVTDMVGFAAAVCMRGLSWVAVPTTLLAMVDAAVGGKTGINLDHGKNLVGAFWAPRLVVIDPVTLATLPPRELRAGLAEVVKAAWIGDRGLLDLLPPSAPDFESLDLPAWENLIERSVRVKAAVVQADEREAGARKKLNLGHTLGHALEAATGYERLLHGEAVMWGLRAACRISRRHGLLSDEGRRRLEGAVDGLGTPPGIDDISPAVVLDHLARDKKRDDLGIGWVLPTEDGVVLDQRVSSDEIAAVLATL